MLLLLLLLLLLLPLLLLLLLLLVLLLLLLLKYDGFFANGSASWRRQPFGVITAPHPLMLQIYQLLRRMLPVAAAAAFAVAATGRHR